MAETQPWPDPSVVPPPGDQQFPGVGVDPYSATALASPRPKKQTSAPASVDQIPIGPEAEINKAAGYDPATGRIQPGGIYDLTRQKQEATEAADQRLINAEQEQLRQLREAHKAVAASPNDLKSWDAQKEQAKYSVSPTEAALNPGFWLAIAASAFTRTPMVNALNGAAASINSLKDGKDEEFKRAYEAWRQNSELAIKRHEMAHQDYEDAIQLYDKDVDTAREQAKLVALKYDDKLALEYLRNGLDDKMIGLVDKRDKMFKDWAQTNAALPEYQVRKDVYNGMMKQINDLKQANNLANDSPPIIALRNRAAVALGAKTDQDEAQAQAMFQWQLDHANDHDGTGPTAEEVWRKTNAMQYDASLAKKGRGSGPQADWESLFYAKPPNASSPSAPPAAPTAPPAAPSTTPAPAGTAPVPATAPSTEKASPTFEGEPDRPEAPPRVTAQVASSAPEGPFEQRWQGEQGEQGEQGQPRPVPPKQDFGAALTGQEEAAPVLDTLYKQAKSQPYNNPLPVASPPPDPREAKIQLAMNEERTPESRAMMAQLLQQPIDGNKKVEIIHPTDDTIPQDVWEKPFGDRKFNESALDGLTPAARSIVRGLVEGKIAPPTGFLLAKSAFWEKALETATEYDPSFDSKIWSVRSAAMKDMLSGVTARNAIRRFNTFAQHVDILNQAETDLNNYKSYSFWLGTKGANRLRKEILEQAQDDRIYAFNVAANAVANEAEAVFRAQGSSVEGIKSWRNNMDAGMSLDGSRKANATLMKLVVGQMNSVADRWNKAFGSNLPGLAFASPEGRENIKRLMALQDARERIAKHPKDRWKIEIILKQNGIDPSGLNPEDLPPE